MYLIIPWPIGNNKNQRNPCLLGASLIILSFLPFENLKIIPLSLDIITEFLKYRPNDGFLKSIERLQEFILSLLSYSPLGLSFLHRLTMSFKNSIKVCLRLINHVASFLNQKTRQLGGRIWNPSQDIVPKKPQGATGQQEDDTQDLNHKILTSRSFPQSLILVSKLFYP